jgi:hypothetical protein
MNRESINSASSIKYAVSVTEMARAVGLSRSRFYQLVGTAFPPPSRDGEFGRPFYNAEQQATCLEVRRRNCGIDGQPILFYSARAPSSSIAQPIKRKVAAKKPRGQFGEIADAVRGLGLTAVNDEQVEQVVKELFPNGTTGHEVGEVIRAVFVRLVSRTRSIVSGDK